MCDLILKVKSLYPRWCWWCKTSAGLKYRKSRRSSLLLIIENIENSWLLINRKQSERCGALDPWKVFAGSRIFDHKTRSDQLMIQILADQLELISWPAQTRSIFLSWSSTHSLEASDSSVAWEKKHLEMSLKHWKYKWWRVPVTFPHMFRCCSPVYTSVLLPGTFSGRQRRMSRASSS